MSESSLRRLWRRGQVGWPPDAPIAQFPNAPLLTAIAAWIVARLSDGAAHDIASAVFYVALACFAWWEVSDGVNTFRKLVGAVVLAWIVFSLSRALGA